MVYIRKVTLLVVIFLMAFTTLLTTKTANAEDDITGTLAPEMREAVERRILFGYGDGKFGQDYDVTRGEFAAFMERALKLPTATGSFIDVRKDSNLAPSIYAVAKAGIMIGGTDNTFSPKKPITRAEIALTMEKALIYSNMVLVQKKTNFNDMDSIKSSSVVRAINNAVYYNIILGDNNMFNPFSNASRAEAAAFIIRLLKAKESYGPPVVEPPVPPTPEPPEDPTLFQLAVINNNELIKTGTTYKTYEEALTVFNGNTHYEGFYLGNELIRVRNGFAYGNAIASNGKLDVTNIYLDYSDASGFRTSVTGIEPGREMRYMGSNDKYIKVQVGATVGYVKHSQTELVPSAIAKGRESYSVSELGMLNHTVYNFITNKFGKYLVGPAPSFMAFNSTYYSYDGVHYRNDRGQEIGTHFPYFQFLSARSETSYTGAEIDAYIMKILAEKEKDLANPDYKDASTKSKLIGLGSFFKKLEDEKHVNALMMLSLAIHEGDYGMSDTAQTCNNLFGLYKKDSLIALCPEKGDFDTPQEGATVLVDTFLNPGYIEPGSESRAVDYRSNGAVFGNKTTGFNVRYASDPSWGSKAAGRMYSIDLGMGGKDYKTYKKIAITKLNLETNVRTAPSSNSPKLYTYAKKYNGIYPDNAPTSYPLGFPMTVVKTVKGTDGFDWYQVYSDQLSTEYGYIRSDIVNIISYE